jgi:type I restriction enzyme, S subunit
MSESKKLIPRRRFKQFSGYWNTTALGKIAEIVRGASPRPIQDKKWFDKNSDIGWLRISDVTEQEGRIYYLKQRLSLAGQEKTRVLYEPHLLLSIAATVGKPVINYIKTGVHDGFLIFLDTEFDREFLFQYLDMFKLQWQKYGQPGSQVNLNSDIVKNHNIELPNSDEQTQIGEFFKKLDNLITTQQKKLEKAKTLKLAYLTEMFPNEGELKPRLRFNSFINAWHIKDINDLANRYDNLRIPITASNRKVGLTPYYGANGIQDYVQGFTHDGEYILIAEDGANDFKNYPVQYVKGKIWVNNHAHVLQGKIGICNNKFLMNAFKNINIEPYLVGGSRAKLNSDTMMNISLKVPNITEQTKIGNFFKLLDDKIALEQKKLNKLKNIKQAYLNEMFV